MMGDHTWEGGWQLTVCVQNFSSLAGLEVTEKFDSIYYSSWVGGRKGEWLEKVDLRLTSALD